MITRLFLSVLEVSIYVGVVSAMLILLAPFLNRRYAVKWKYFIWIFLALRLVIPYKGEELLSFAVKAVNFFVVKDEKAEGDFITEPTAEPPILVEIPWQMTTPIANAAESNVREVSLLDVLACIWLAGCLCILLFFISGYIRYRICVKKAGKPMEESLIRNRRDELSVELHIKRSVPVIEYSEAASPMVMGFAKPFLVLPSGAYDEGTLYFILKHEMVHLKRHDVYFKLLLVAANAVHWFNPLIWIMRKEAVVDMELSCDERVIRGEEYAVKKAYTETLLSTLHNNCAKKTVLSTQFYGGKQVMKKRFQNILAKADKKNGRLIFMGAVVLTLIMGMLVGCTDSGRSVGENQGSGAGRLADEDQGLGVGRLAGENQSSGAGQLADGVDAPAVVLTCAENWAAYLYSSKREYDENYINWRIQSLSHCYTYEDFDGMVLQVYQMNCEYWHERPDEIVLAGGMEITEDGWVTDEYPNSRYLVFKQEGDVLSLLAELYENDCFPGDDIFTDDIRQSMKPMETSIDAGENMTLDIDLASGAVNLTKELDIPDNSFWGLEELQADTGTLTFSTGLQLTLPREWMDRTVMSANIGADDSGDALMFWTKDETDDGIRRGLLLLRYVNSEGYDSDNPYSILNSETVKVLGIYHWQDKEYLLVGEVPQVNFIGGEKTWSDYTEMVEANRDIIESVREVKIRTDKMDGFIECGAEDLDWVKLWPTVYQ